MIENNIWTSAVDFILGSDNDVVDGDVDELHEETDETHDAEPNSGCHSDLLKLFSVGLGAPLYQAAGILVKLLGRLGQAKNLIHSFCYREEV